MADVDVAQVEERLQVHFLNPKLLQHALTHRSVLVEVPGLLHTEQYERLEFLGDAVLSLVAAEELYAHMLYADEGRLSQLRAAYVCEANLVLAANRLHLENWILVAKSVRASGMLHPSIVADVLEALIGALYLDQGFLAAKEFVLRVLGPVPLQLGPQQKDSKSLLQEKIQALCSITPHYVVVGTKGTAHQPIFEVHVCVGARVLAVGEGSNKKEASQAAAQKALELFAEQDAKTILGDLV